MPPFHFPFLYNPNYYNKYTKAISSNYSIPYTSYKKNSQKYINCVKDSYSSISNNKIQDSSYENYFFELFGIKLYFDDILLICLLFSLYMEGIKDDELFISLILLLLS